MDIIISMARAVKQATGESVGWWVVDETSPFRQLPILFRDRSLAVIVLENPETKIVSYFVMIGHPFGLTPSVSQPQARCGSDWVSSVRVLPSLPVLLVTTDSAEARLVEQVCFWLGVDVNGKTEFGQRFDLLASAWTA